MENLDVVIQEMKSGADDVQVTCDVVGNAVPIFILSALEKHEGFR
jgi:hypothetical protein